MQTQAATTFRAVPHGLVWIPLDEATGARLWATGLQKGVLRDERGHDVVCVDVVLKAGQRPVPRYVKRWKGANGKWRYAYAAHEGGGVHNAAHFTEGARFKHGNGHYEVHGDGTATHSHTGQKVNLGELQQHLATEHAPAIAAHKKEMLKRFVEQIGEAQTAKHKAALEKKAAAYGYEKPKPSRGLMIAQRDGSMKPASEVPGEELSDAEYAAQWKRINDLQYEVDRMPGRLDSMQRLTAIGVLDKERAKLNLPPYSDDHYADRSADHVARGRARVAETRVREARAAAKEAAAEAAKKAAEGDYDFSGGAPDAKGAEAKPTPEAKAAAKEAAQPPDRMEHSPQSSHIKHVEWTADNPKSNRGTLRVHFKNGHVHDHLDRHRDVYTKMANAPSAGQFYNEHVRGIGESKTVREASPVQRKEAADDAQKRRREIGEVKQQSAAMNHAALTKPGSVEATPQGGMPKVEPKKDATPLPAKGEPPARKVTAGEYRSHLGGLQFAVDTANSSSDASDASIERDASQLRDALAKLKAVQPRQASESMAREAAALRAKGEMLLSGLESGEAKQQRASSVARLQARNAKGLNPSQANYVGDKAAAKHSPMQIARDVRSGGAAANDNTPAPAKPSTAPPADMKAPPPAEQPAERSRDEHYNAAQRVYGLSDKQMQAVKRSADAAVAQHTKHGDHDKAKAAVRDAVHRFVFQDRNMSPSQATKWMRQQEGKNVEKASGKILTPAQHQQRVNAAKARAGGYFGARKEMIAHHEAQAQAHDEAAEGMKALPKGSPSRDIGLFSKHREASRAHRAAAAAWGSHERASAADMKDEPIYSANARADLDGASSRAAAMSHRTQTHLVEKGLSAILKALGRFTWVEIPESLAESLIAKGKSHKYIKKVATGKTTKTGRPVYRYYYKVAADTHAAKHFTVGSAFADGKGGGHWHIHGKDGDKIHLKHDETGEERHVSASDLSSMLHGAHNVGAVEEAKRAKAKAEVEAAKQSGTAKHVEAAKKRAEAAGVKEAPPDVEPKAPTKTESLVQWSDDRGSVAPSPGSMAVTGTGDNQRVWVVLSSSSENVSGRDRAAYEDMDEFRGAQAKRRHDLTVRAATPDEAKAYAKWQDEVKAIDDAKRGFGGPKIDWKQRELADEDLPRVLPYAEGATMLAAQAKAKPDVYRRAAERHNGASKDVAALREVARDYMENMRERQGRDPWVKQDIARLEENLGRPDAEFEPREGYTLSSHAQHGLDAMGYADVAARALSGDKGAQREFARVAKRHGLTADNLGKRWRVPTGAEKIGKDPYGEIYLDSSDKKLWHHGAGSVTWAPHTPEAEAAIREHTARASSAPPTKPKVGLTKDDKALASAPRRTAPAPKAASAPVPKQAATTPRLQFRNTDSGWAVFGPAKHVKAGQSHTVHKKDGSTSTAYVTRTSKPFSVAGVPHVYGFMKGSLILSEKGLSAILKALTAAHRRSQRAAPTRAANADHQGER